MEDLYRRFSVEWDARHDRTEASRYKPYFLGPYVYFQDGETTYLVDGQQRVSTLHMLLILIRNLLVEQDSLNEARQLETLICNVMYGKRRYTIDIAERAPLLDALMNGKTFEVRPDDPPSVRNLWDRYGDLEDQFPPELRGEALPYFHDWLLHRVCLVGIEAHDQGHGWEIFETMNDRGLQLSPVDLLKSFLLAKSEQKQPRRLNETWRKAMTGLSALGGMGAATDFVKALLVGRYADPGDASDLTRIETSFHEWIRGNLTRMDLVRPADFADFANFVTDEFAPHADAYCTLFRAAQSPDSNTDLHSLFFNNVNGIRSQFQLIFAAVRRGDSPEQIRAKARRVADYLDLLYVHRVISGHSAHPSELDAVIRDLIPKLRNSGDLEAVTGLLSAELAADPGDFADVTTFSLGPDNRRCPASFGMGMKATLWLGMRGLMKGPAGGFGGALWCPGCRGGGRAGGGQPFARVMAAVTSSMLRWSSEPRTRARWTGMAGWPRLAAMRRMPASEPVQASRRASRAVMADSQSIQA